jgi:uncharacterized protein
VLKAVLDTNVFVSGLLVRSGQPAQVLHAWRERRFLLIVGPALIDEVCATLEYPRIRRKYVVSSADIDDLVDMLHRDALVLPGIDAETLTTVSGAVPADPDDEAVLACALAGAADIIVSGDHHLLDLGSFRGVPIESVREFLAHLDSKP